MIIRPIAYSEILNAPNATELLAEYAAECALPEIGPIDPQADMYALMEQSRAFQCFGVYEGPELVGFASFLAYVVPHYGKRIATVESLFIARSERKGRAGNELMAAIEEYARRCGCVAILYSAPADSQFEQLLGLLRPYRHSNTVFARSL